LIDRTLTSVTNAKQKKKTKSAQHKAQHLPLLFELIGMFVHFRFLNNFSNSQ